MGVYLGSSFVLMLIISILIFNYEKDVQLKAIRMEMFQVASKMVSEVVALHMQTQINHKEALNTFISRHKDASMTLFDSRRRILYSTIPESLELIKEHRDIGFFNFRGAYYLITDKTFAHLGVAKILFKNSKPLNFSSLYRNIILVFAIAFLCVIGISIFLGRLFLKPIRNEITRIDNFLKNTTHELNTPMSALLLSLKTLEDNEQHRRIKIAIKRMSFLYRSLSYLVMQDIERELPVILDLKALITKENLLFSEIIAYHKLELKSELSVVKLKAREQDFISLYSNLIMNAIKYNVVHGYIHVELTPEFLKVKSLGHEIPKDKITELSVRYARFNSSVLGYGIGLDLVKKVCENYKMRLVIHSEPCLNSSFYENSFCIVWSENR
ncbi:signal-transducing protein, histidine kinase [Helicobacter cetorum MIT 99-5656]|uniref:histidine kinase n=1 Tax=Helicobacter cetorum (strain ATCC BAA-540 / CCUG 52418 / MIT 99-5656) TaxID=1163745 RepID=I0ESC8_HELCM|nr:signal-transducing protein, histidine kinase [Helicobacter cetorum MIT 99-5656]